MNAKNLIFFLLCITSINLLLKGFDQESKQSKEQTNYTKLLAIFPNVKPALKKKNITEQIINDYPRMRSMVGGTVVYFSNDDMILIITKKPKVGFQIVTREKIDYHADSEDNT